MPFCLFILYYIDYCCMSLFKTAYAITSPRKARDPGRPSRTSQASLLPCVVCGHLCLIGYLYHVVFVTHNPGVNLHCSSASHSFATWLNTVFGMWLAHSICLPSLSLLHLMQLLPWCPGTIYHPQASHPTEQSWRECSFSVSGLAGIQGLVASDLQFHLIMKRADSVAGETA